MKFHKTVVNIDVHYSDCVSCGPLLPSLGPLLCCSMEFLVNLLSHVCGTVLNDCVCATSAGTLVGVCGLIS